MANVIYKNLTAEDIDFALVFIIQDANLAGYYGEDESVNNRIDRLFEAYKQLEQEKGDNNGA